MPNCECGHPYELHLNSNGEPGLCEPCFGDNAEHTNWCGCKDYHSVRVGVQGRK